MSMIPQEKIRAELPSEIILLEILPRLPAKSTGRFRCVCKQWQSFLSTKEFERKNLHYITNNESQTHCKILINQPQDLLTGILPISETFVKLDCEAPEHYTFPIRFIPFKVDRGVSLFVSLDGLVCVAIEGKPSELILWNPLTRVYKKLSYNLDCPGFNIRLGTLGFYKDSSNDYKILHIVTKGSLKAYIYSTRLDSWRKIECLENFLPISKQWSSGTFCGESLYFIARDNKIDKNLIIGFDVNSEKFREIQLPLVPSGASFFGCLVNVRDCIHLFVTYEMGGDTLHPSRLDIWRMEGEEWHSVAAFSREERYTFTWIPLYIMRNGKWLVMASDGIYTVTLYEVDMKTNDYVCLYQTFTFDSFRAATYIEALVSPN